MASPLKDELARRGSEAQQYAGVPPVGQYWLIVEHGHEIAKLLTENKWSFRRLAVRFDVAPETLKRTVIFISENEEVVASKNWPKLEELLFGRWPDFRSMPFYRDYIVPGNSGPYRKQFRDGKKLGRRVGSKNKPKILAPTASPSVSLPATPAAPDPEQGRVVTPPTNPAPAPAVVVVAPKSPDRPAAPPPSADPADIDLPEAWSAKRARQLSSSSSAPRN